LVWHECNRPPPVGLNLETAVGPQINANFRGFKRQKLKLQEKAFHFLGESGEDCFLF
jgi:hypothetical protein